MIRVSRILRDAAGQYPNKKIFVYLNEQGKVCFTGPCEPELIKDLAWDSCSRLSADTNTLNKKVYKKAGLKSFYLKATMQKQDVSEAWQLKTVERTSFQLADGRAFITSDNLVFEI